MTSQTLIFAGMVPFLAAVGYAGLYMAWEAVRDRVWRDVMVPGLIGLGAVISVAGIVMQLEGWK